MINGNALIHRLLRGCDRCRPATAVQVGRPQPGEYDLGGGQNTGGQLDPPVGGCETVRWSSQKVTGLLWANPPSFGAYRRVCAGDRRAV